MNEGLHNCQFIYTSVTPFARLQSEISEYSIQWILYGKNPDIFDSGHILEIMLKQDLNELHNLTKPVKLFNPLIALCSRNVIKKFMSSEAHQLMLDGNCLNHHDNDLREYLKRSFSVTYINDSLTSLKKITRAIQWWSRIKWFIFSLLACYFAIIINHISKLKKIGKMNPFLTHPSVYDTPFSASAIFELFKSYGPTIIIMMIIITFISSFWIKIWFRLAGTASLLKWGKKNKLIDNKWIITSILGCVVMLFLLYYFPAKIDQQNNIFGFISIDKIIKFFR